MQCRKQVCIYQHSVSNSPKTPTSKNSHAAYVQNSSQEDMLCASTSAHTPMRDLLYAVYVGRRSQDAEIVKDMSVSIRMGNNSSVEEHLKMAIVGDVEEDSRVQTLSALTSAANRADLALNHYWSLRRRKVETPNPLP